MERRRRGGEAWGLREGRGGRTCAGASESAAAPLQCMFGGRGASLTSLMRRRLTGSWAAERERESEGGREDRKSVV